MLKILVCCEKTYIYNLIGSDWLRTINNKNKKDGAFLIESVATGIPHSPKANIAEYVATSLSSLLGFFLAVWLEEPLPIILYLEVAGRGMEPIPATGKKLGLLYVFLLHGWSQLRAV